MQINRIGLGNSTAAALLTAATLAISTLPLAMADTPRPADTNNNPAAAKTSASEAGSASASTSTTSSAPPAQGGTVTSAGSSNTDAASSQTTPTAPTANPQDASSDTTAASTSAESAQASPQKVIWHRGATLSTTTNTEDIVATYDIPLAEKQVAAYPDNPEAMFILAVALTRTSRVEDALSKVQKARRMAQEKGATAYFDKMIDAYEKMLTAYPNDNEARYGLAWAYYMKAYLLAQHSRWVARWKAANPELAARLPNATPAASGTAGSGSGATTSDSTQSSTNQAVKTSATGRAAKAQAGQAVSSQDGAQAAAKTSPALQPGAKASLAVVPKSQASSNSAGANNQAVVDFLSGKINPANMAQGIAQIAGAISSGTSGQPLPLSAIPHIPGALEKAEPADIPQIRKYYELALGKLDEILVREPKDVWSIVYRAHLKAEYTGNLTEAMQTWHHVQSEFPNNPAAYFFLAEGYLKLGNLQESLRHASKAIALRSLGY